MDDWIDWSERRPDAAGLYWWRVMSRPESGIVPEFVCEACSHGMGYEENQLWPRFSHWNGFSRSVPVGTQWRPISGTEKRDDFVYPGLELYECPFCGKTPAIEWLEGCQGGGVVMNSYLLRANQFRLECRCGKAQTRWMHSLAAARDSWNTRHSAVCAAN